MAEMKAGYNWNGPALTPDLLAEFFDKRDFDEEPMANGLVDITEQLKQFEEAIAKACGYSPKPAEAKAADVKPSIITCPGPSCGKENDAGVKSCWWCGGKL